MNKATWAMTAVLMPVALGAPAFAQFAVTTSNADGKTVATPVKGANSFTMDETRRRIEAGGFSQVTGLRKHGDGICRGQAMRGGTSVSVFCDYQGNIGAS